MKQLTVTIANLQPLTTNLQLLTLSSPDLPQLRSGQLILARVNDSFDPYLRRAYFPHARTSTLDLLIADTDPLARKMRGDLLDLIAPIGNGFTLEASTRRLLLVGDEAHLAPLIALAHEATQKQIAITLLVQGTDGGRQTGPVPAEAARTGRADGGWRVLERLLPLDVEYQFASAVPADLLRWPDQVCAAGPPAMYAQLRERITQALLVIANNFVQVIASPPMACGFGACLSCAVETTRGVRLACVDGPVFDLMELNG